MLTINKTWAALPAGNIQSSQKQDSPKLKTLNMDTVSFSGTRKYVSQAVYDTVCQYVENNLHTKAGHFMRHIKAICEEGTTVHLDELSGLALMEVEKEKAKGVSAILTKVKDSLLSNSGEKRLLEKWMDRFKNTLDTM